MERLCTWREFRLERQPDLCSVASDFGSASAAGYRLRCQWHKLHSNCMLTASFEEAGWPCTLSSVSLLSVMNTGAVLHIYSFWTCGCQSVCILGCAYTCAYLAPCCNNPPSPRVSPKYTEVSPKPGCQSIEAETPPALLLTACYYCSAAACHCWTQD